MICPVSRPPVCGLEPGLRVAVIQPVGRGRKYPSGHGQPLRCGLRRVTRRAAANEAKEPRSGLTRRSPQRSRRTPASQPPAPDQCRRSPAVGTVSSSATPIALPAVPPPAKAAACRAAASRRQFMPSALSRSIRARSPSTCRRPWPDSLCPSNGWPESSPIIGPTRSMESQVVARLPPRKRPVTGRAAQGRVRSRRGRRRRTGSSTSPSRSSSGSSRRWAVPRSP